MKTFVNHKRRTEDQDTVHISFDDFLTAPYPGKKMCTLFYLAELSNEKLNAIKCFQFLLSYGSVTIMTIPFFLRLNCIFFTLYAIGIVLYPAGILGYELFLEAMTIRSIKKKLKAIEENKYL